MINPEIYEKIKQEKDLIELLYRWYRFPDEKLHKALREAIPVINSFYPNREKITVYRGYRKLKENKTAHLSKRNSNWQGINPFALKENANFNLELKFATSFSRSEYTAMAFTMNGKDRLVIQSQFELPSEDLLVYTDEIYRAILVRYHITALIAPGMEEIIAVPKPGSKLIIPATVKFIETTSARDW